jgi:hypothetical protein
LTGVRREDGASGRDATDGQYSQHRTNNHGASRSARSAMRANWSFDDGINRGDSCSDGVQSIT